METPASVEMSNSWPLTPWAPHPQCPALHASPYPWLGCTLESSGYRLWFIPRMVHSEIMPPDCSPHAFGSPTQSLLMPPLFRLFGTSSLRIPPHCLHYPVFAAFSYLPSQLRFHTPTSSTDCLYPGLLLCPCSSPTGIWQNPDPQQMQPTAFQNSR